MITNDDSQQALRAQQALDTDLNAGRKCVVGNILVFEVM